MYTLQVSDQYQCLLMHSFKGTSCPIMPGTSCTAVELRLLSCLVSGMKGQFQIFKRTESPFGFQVQAQVQSEASPSM